MIKTKSAKCSYNLKRFFLYNYQNFLFILIVIVKIIRQDLRKSSISISYKIYLFHFFLDLIFAIFCILEQYIKCKRFKGKKEKWGKRMFLLMKTVQNYLQRKHSKLRKRESNFFEH